MIMTELPPYALTEGMLHSGCTKLPLFFLSELGLAKQLFIFWSMFCLDFWFLLLVYFVTEAEDMARAWSNLPNLHYLSF